MHYKVTEVTSDLLLKILRHCNLSAQYIFKMAEPILIKQLFVSFGSAVNK